MANENLISADEFCVRYNAELSFITALHEYGLIEIITVEENYFIDDNQLQKLEQYARWHYDFDINLEGIEVIDHLLDRVKNLQDEIIELQNKLKLYDTNSRRIFMNQTDE
jgi:hypothetical protein